MRRRSAPIELAMSGNPVDDSRERFSRKDPVTAGPKLFEMRCAVCHTYVPSDPNAPVKFDSPNATASDLAGYETEKWIRGLLNDHPARATSGEPSSRA